MADKDTHKSIDEAAIEIDCTSQKTNEQPVPGIGEQDNIDRAFRRYDSDSNRCINGRYNYNSKQDPGLDIIINSRITTKDVRDRLWSNRDFEISHLWQRSIFLNTLLILCFTGYGVTVMALVNALSENGSDATAYTINNILLVICLVSAIFSCFCIMMAKGSKAWYERYEKAIRAFEGNKDYMSEAVLYSGELYAERENAKEDKQQVGIGGFQCMNIKGYDPVSMKDSLFNCKAGAYSPSRINIAIGQVALILWCIAFAIHLLLTVLGFEIPELIYKWIIPGILLCVSVFIAWYYKKMVKADTDIWIKSKVLLEEKKMRKEENNNDTKENDKKKSFKYLWLLIGGVFLLFIAAVPVFLYFNQFGFILPKNREDCGLMGDFIGGTTNAILNFFTLIFSLLAVYISVRISYKIQTRNEIQLQMQSKPIPFVRLVSFPNKISIEIQNMGVGSMIITDIKLVKEKDGKEVSYPHFRELLEKEGILEEGIEFTYDTSPDFALAPNFDVKILLIDAVVSDNLIKMESMRKIKSVIGEYTLKFEYKDVFDKIGYHEKQLSFLKR